MDHEHHDHEEEKEETLATPGVMDKYQTAGKIANQVLQEVIAKTIPGASVYQICQFADVQIKQEVGKHFNK